MAEYEFLDVVDKGKIFIVKRSKLEGRFDSFYYCPQFEELEVLIHSSIYPKVKLNCISKSITNGYDFRDYKQSGIPYIKVANIRQGYFNFKNIQYINISSEDINKNIQLKKGNLLLTRKGTFGNALSLGKDYEYIISSEVFYIELKKELVEAKYLEIFFNSDIGQKQFNRISIGAIMGSLSQEALKNVTILLPPRSIQQQIAILYQSAYTQKQQKEAEAKQLLDGIDNYLLNKLGITLPEKDDSLQSRIFTTQFKDITGGRFDPKGYEKYIIELKSTIKNICSSNYISKPLTDFIVQGSAGGLGCR